MKTTKKNQPVQSNNSGLFTNGTNTTDSGCPAIVPPLNRFTNAVQIAQRKEEKAQAEVLKLELTPVSSEPPPPTTWIYQDWLEQGELTVLAGEPAAGKTFLSCALAAGITRGEGFELYPGLTPQGNGYVVFVNREDDARKTLEPRLKAAGADMNRIRFINKDADFSFFNEVHLNRLQGHSQLLGNNFGLIVIDPIYHAVNGDHRNDFKARQAYEGLTTLARRLRCAILGITHTTSKTEGKGPLYRVDGPPAIRQVPRSIMLLSKIAQGPTERGGTHILVHAKNNNGRIDGGFECCVKSVDAQDPTVHGPQLKMTITGELMGSAEDLVNDADRRPQAERGQKTKTAEEFLRSILEDGPKLRIDIEPLAIDAGIAIGTLLLAKTLLKIVTVKGENGRSLWSLPGSVDETGIEQGLKVDQTGFD